MRIEFICPKCNFEVFGYGSYNQPICPNCTFNNDKYILMNLKNKVKNMTYNNNKFLDKLKEESNYTRTENQALTYKSTLSGLLDFFSIGGAIRGREDSDVIRLFSKALAENQLLALKALFYFRDVRGGQGERKTFRTILKWLGNNYPHIVAHNLKNVPFYGRWDDLFSLVNTRVELPMFSVLNTQYLEDLYTETPSLLGKWLKSTNTSSKESCKLAKLTMRRFAIKSEKQYRKSLSTLRKRIKIVETQMCNNEWDNINYEHVPSKAGMIYSKAFRKHNPEGYEKYLEDVKSGKKKIQTKTLYPYEILRAILRERTEEYNLMWDNLPDYTEGKEENSIVVCDTSGSMTGMETWGSGYKRTVEPILVSVSLAMYFAERAKGPYQNHFITFSSRPDLQEIRGIDLYTKFVNLANAHWDGNTDLIAVFRLILDVATKNDISQDEMIQKIYIISDMEFDSCVENTTNHQYIKEMYKLAGYEMPKLVYWNVESRQDQVPITVNESNTFMVSGCSPSIFKNLMQSNAMNAYDLMLDVLNSERYNQVVL